MLKVSESLQARDWIAGLERGLSVIEAFDENHSRMTAQQVGDRCGLTRTAARRYLLTLQHLGYVSADAKHFWLTPRIMRLGQSYLSSARLPRIAQPILQRGKGSQGDEALPAILEHPAGVGADQGDRGDRRERRLPGGDAEPVVHRPAAQPFGRVSHGRHEPVRTGWKRDHPEADRCSH